jgi:hypothetical protein
MNYNELIQLYFERSSAMQQYWNLYVIIVGGVLAFSSLRKQPAAITTALVCILFALFAYENLDAMKDTTSQRFATLEAIKQFDSGAAGATPSRQVRDLLAPLSEASKSLTSPATCLPSPRFARWNCGGED